MPDDPRTIRRDIGRLQQALRQLADTTQPATSNAQIQRANTTIGGLPVGNIDTTITWPRPWPDNGYAVIINIISGTGALGSLTATLKAGTKTPTDCVVTVANTGALPVGNFGVDVIGIRT